MTLVHESSIVDEGVVIGEGTRIWQWCHVTAGASIGRGCVLGQGVYVAEGVRVGNNVKIENNVSVFNGVELEDDVFCGPSCVFTNVKTPRAHISRRGEYVKTLVKKGATIGANATILCGVTIGQYAMVGAGAVITQDVQDYALMYGNPAKRHGWSCSCGATLIVKDVLVGDRCICPVCGERFHENKGQLIHD